MLYCPHSLFASLCLFFRSLFGTLHCHFLSTVLLYVGSLKQQENREGSQRVSSITASYSGPSHSVAIMTSSISSDEDMLDITTAGTTQVKHFSD